MPVWSLQLARIASLPLNPGSVPYGGLIALGLLGLLCVLLGMLTNHYQSAVARKIHSLLKPFSYFTIVSLLLTTIIGGMDLMGMILWREGLSCCMWSLLVAVVITIVFSTTSFERIQRIKAAGSFLLLKYHYYAFEYLSHSLRPTLADASLIGAFFFSFMTLLVAMTLTIVFICYRCIMARESSSSSRDRLVYEVSTESMERVDLSEESYVNNPVKVHYDYEYEKVINAQITTTSWGVPLVGWSGF